MQYKKNQYKKQENGREFHTNKNKILCTLKAHFLLFDLRKCFTILS